MCKILSPGSQVFYNVFPSTIADLCGRLNNALAPNTQEPVSVTTYGERGFAGVITDLEMRRLSQIKLLGLKCNHK